MDAASPPTPPASRLRRALPWLAIGVGFLLVHVARPGVFESTDYVRFHVLNQEYLWNAIRSGRLPLWNPHVALGRPFLADVETAFFYPPYWIRLFLPPGVAVALLLAAHSTLGAFAMSRLARTLGIGPRLALLPGLLFLASGTVIELVAAGQILYYAGVCYLPWAMLATLRLLDGVTRRRIAALAAVLALQILASHPQVFWITCVGASFLVLCLGCGRPWARSCALLARVYAAQAAAIALALGVTAIQVLPFVELIEEGNRQARSLTFASGWALPLAGLASLVHPVPTGNWSDNLYGGSLLAIAGVAGLLCSRGRGSRALAVLALLGLTLALGTATPLFALAYRLLPGLSFFRVPGRLALLALFALALASGLLLERVQLRRRAELVVAALGLGLAALVLVVPSAPPAGPGWLRCLALLATTAALVAYLRARPGPGAARRVAPVALAVLALVELGHGAWLAKAAVADPADYRAEAQARQALAGAGLFTPDGVPPRVSIPFPLARENAGMRYGWSTFTGYIGLWLGRTWEYVHTAVGLEVPTRSMAFPASNVYQGAFPYDGAALVLGIDPASGRGAIRAQPDPRAYVVHATRVVPHWRVALAAMRAGFDYHRTALVEEAIPGLPAETGAATELAVIRAFAAEHIEVEVATASPGLLVLAESYFPGWSATVNGEPASCLPANGWMRAVSVPAGTSRVVLSFTSSRLAQGAWVSLLAIVVVLLLAFSTGRRPAEPARGAHD